MADSIDMKKISEATGINEADIVTTSTMYRSPAYDTVVTVKDKITDSRKTVVIKPDGTYTAEQK